MYYSFARQSPRVITYWVVFFPNGRKDRFCLDLSLCTFEEPSARVSIELKTTVNVLLVRDPQRKTWIRRASCWQRHWASTSTPPQSSSSLLPVQITEWHSESKDHTHAQDENRELHTYFNYRIRWVISVGTEYFGLPARSFQSSWVRWMSIKV